MLQAGLRIYTAADQVPVPRYIQSICIDIVTGLLIKI